MTMSFLSIQNIAKRFGAVVAVENVSLDIAKGEFMTFLGPSGSGKSTTLYIIAGFSDPSSGRVELEGKSLLTIPSNKRNIGMVFQRYTLFPNLSVGDNVAFPLKVRRRPKAEIDAKVAAMLKLIRLDKFADRMPGALSGGQQQRIALARALIYDPPILLMDEPLSALDKKLREEMQFEIKRIHNETGVTILYVTHDQEEALRLSDRVALFNHGHIEQVGSGRDLYEHPRSRFVANFIGNSNFIPGRIVARASDMGQLALPDGSVLDNIPLVGLEHGAKDALMMVRPERISLKGAAFQSNRAGLRGTITDMVYLGDVMHFSVRTMWGDTVDVRTTVDALQSSVPQRGEAVQLSWSTDHARAFGMP